jgi:hypothetical protein
MPNRAAHLIAFLTIVLISAGLHVYIYRQLARLVKRDFPRQSKTGLKIAKVLFVYFDLPFLYLFFWKHLTFDTSVITTVLLFPFAVWQMVMLVWGLIVVPIGIYRSKYLRSFRRATSKLIVKPIRLAVRRSLRPRREVILEPSEEIA